MARRLEDALCQSINSWNAWARPDCFAFHVPNGGHRHKATAALLKSMGVKAGVFDWVVLMPGGRTGFVETKAGKGRLTDKQKEFQALAVALGFETAECRSLEEWQMILKSWGVKWGKSRAA